MPVAGPQGGLSRIFAHQLAIEVEAFLEASDASEIRRLKTLGQAVVGLAFQHFVEKIEGQRHLPALFERPGEVDPGDGKIGADLDR